MAESPEHEAAVRLADKIKAKALPSPFTCKAVYDKGWHGLKDRHEVDAACNILIDENWLNMERKPATGSLVNAGVESYGLSEKTTIASHESPLTVGFCIRHALHKS